MDSGEAKKLVSLINRQTEDDIDGDIMRAVKKSGCTDTTNGDAMYNAVVSDLAKTRKIDNFYDTVDIKAPIKSVRSPYEYRLNKSVGQLSAIVELKKESQFIEDIAISLVFSGGKSKAGKLWQYFDFFPHKFIKRVRITDSTGKIDIADYTGEAYNVYYNYILPTDKKNTYRECIYQANPWNSEYKVGQNISTLKSFIYGAQSFSDTHNEMVVHLPLLFKSTNLMDINKYGDKLVFTIDVEPNVEAILYPQMTPSDFLQRPQLTDQCSVIITQLMINPNIYDLLKYPINTSYNKKLNSFYRCYSLNLSNNMNLSLKRLVGDQNFIVKLFVGIRPKSNLVNPRIWYSNDLYRDMLVRDTVFDNATNTFMLVSRNEKVRETSRWVTKVTVRNGESEYFDNDLQPEFFRNYLPIMNSTISTNDQSSDWFLFPFNNKPHEIDGMLPMSINTDYKLYTELDETKVNKNDLELFIVAECCNLVNSNFQ